jgi:hypothetical protein
MTRDTEYANTDLDLKSAVPFDRLNRELASKCRVLHYTHGDDGNWHSIVEASHGSDSRSRNAEMDIAAIIDAIRDLSSEAKAELRACHLRQFDIGFHCWDTWGFGHAVPNRIVHAIAEIDCSLSITLYPMRNPDGSPKE